MFTNGFQISSYAKYKYTCETVHVCRQHPVEKHREAELLCCMSTPPSYLLPVQHFSGWTTFFHQLHKFSTPFLRSIGVSYIRITYRGYSSSLILWFIPSSNYLALTQQDPKNTIIHNLFVNVLWSIFFLFVSTSSNTYGGKKLLKDFTSHSACELHVVFVPNQLSQQQHKEVSAQSNA